MKLIRPTEERVQYVAENIRYQDDQETRLSHGISGYEAVLISAADSSDLRVIVADDNITPIGVTGLVGDRIWMLGTDGLTATRSHRRQLVTLGREWVEWCLEQAAPIGNDVLASNTASIRWLLALGFEVETARPMGPSLALFCPFWRFG